MARIRLQTTKQEAVILTKAARRTGFHSPSQFVMALFDGSHASRRPRETTFPFKLDRVAPYRWKP